MASQKEYKTGHWYVVVISISVKVVALMCDLHDLLVGEPKGVLERGVFSCTKDDLEGTGMKQSRRLDGLQTKSSLRLDFPLEVLFIYTGGNHS